MRHVSLSYSSVVLSNSGLRSPLARAEEPKEFAALKYRLVGPFAGGRVSRACGVPGDPLTYYAATASGGVWKSTDGGLTWKPIFDDQPTSSHRPHRGRRRATRTSSTSAPARRTSAATSRRARASSRATDGGKTWKHVWKQVGQIGTMAVHPTNADVAFAAVLGHAFGPNSERGVYRTTDGGKTWQKVLFKNDETGARDVCHRPEQPAHHLRRLLADAPPAVGDDQRRPRLATCTSPATAATPGSHWRTPTKARVNEAQRPARRSPGARSASRSPRRTRSASTPSSRPRRAGCSAPTTAARPGRSPTTTRPHPPAGLVLHTLTVHPTNPDVVFAPERAAPEEHRRRQDVRAASAGRTTATTTTSGSTRRTRTG